MIIAAPVVKGGCQMMAQNAPQEPIVVDTPFVHDPVMAYENGKYYLYCTGHGITQMTLPTASIGPSFLRACSRTARFSGPVTR